MKIFALDKVSVSSTEEWMKQWSTLGEIEVHNCSTLDSRDNAFKSIEKCRETTSLLLVHREQCPLMISRELENLSASCPRLLVMYVSGGSNPKDLCANLQFVHFSRRKVPSGTDLSYLKTRFSRLCRYLDDAGSDVNKISLAWEDWESPVFGKLILKLAPLGLVTANNRLFELVAKQIHESFSPLDLLLAERELGNSDCEVELRKWMTGSLDYHELSSWFQKYPNALIDFSRRFL